jgi:hypothetical protein
MAWGHGGWFSVQGFPPSPSTLCLSFPASLACIPCLSHLPLSPASLALPSLLSFRAATRPIPALFQPPQINASRGGESEGIPLLLLLVVVVAAVALHFRLKLQYTYFFYFLLVVLPAHKSQPPGPGLSGITMVKITFGKLCPVACGAASMLSLSIAPLPRLVVVLLGLPKCFHDFVGCGNVICAGHGRV